MREQDGWDRQAPEGLRTSPTGRIPRWVLDEAVGKPVSPEPWRAWSPAGTAPGRRLRRRWLKAAGGAAVVVALVGAGVFLQHTGVPVPGAVAAEPRGVLGFPHPEAGVDASDHPIGTPLPAPVGGGSHEFAVVQDDGATPVAYDPCRPVHYVVRPDNAPAGGQQLVAGAIARISEVTGLQFVYDGPTEEQLAEDRALYQPDRYGGRWAPVLITWETDAENPDLAADVAGEAGSAAVSFPGEPKVYVTGAIALDAAQFGQILSSPGGPAVARAIVLHELAHLVGLAHVADGTQLMYPEASPGVVDFAAGDLTGLSRLGSGACVPTV